MATMDEALKKLLERLAVNLKKYRIARGISQHELSRRSGVSCCIINWMEAGKRYNITLKTLVRLAEALGVKFAELFHGQG